jgi:uncharacterized protein YdcH (DUF465 family)
MVDPTDIEKKSLEAHVELCAERYNALDDKISSLDNKIEKVGTTVTEVHKIVQLMTDKQNERIIQWGTGIIGTLLAVVGWLVANYILNK